MHLVDFVISYNTPTWITNLGWKIFIMYAAINVGAMGIFSLIIPETKGRSLEEMDVIFGAVGAETRRRDIERQRVVMGGMGSDVRSETASSVGSVSEQKVPGPSYLTQLNAFSSTVRVANFHFITPS